jgi:hypothetical protein
VSEPINEARLNGGPPRDIAFERRWTSLAASTVHADGARLSDFAEARAGRDPVHDLANRNFARETLEELADARNYLVWWLEQLATAPGPPDELAGEISEALGMALAAVASAFEQTTRARTLAVEWRAGQR